jgi:hypothetical protein
LINVIADHPLAAGRPAQTGRKFDLETTSRVAEFKFIRWRGGAEAIRQNSVFKDYFFLADHETHKRKYLYLFGTSHALKFLRGGRSLQSVLSRNTTVRDLFFDKYGDRFQTVREYYDTYENFVQLVDLSGWVLELDEISSTAAPDPANFGEIGDLA